MPRRARDAVSGSPRVGRWVHGASIDPQVLLPRADTDSDNRMMNGPPAYQRLFAELKRRKVFRVAAGYGAVAFVVLQAAEIVFPAIGLPERAVNVTVWLALLGFPVALALAWAYELRPEGLKPTDRADERQLEEIVAEPRRRRWLSGVLALAGVVMLATGAWLALRNPRSGGRHAAGEAVTAVLPFSVSGSEAYAYLASGMVDLLSTRMDGVGPTRTVPARAVMGLVRQEGSEFLDAAAAERIASALGAARYVAGRVVESGGRLEITAAMYEVDAENVLTEASAAGTADQLFDLVDNLTTQLVARLEVSPGGRVRQLAALTTNSLPALKAYLTGEELFRRGQFTSALSAFEEATSLDTTFALAHYRVSVAREWGGQAGATEAAEKAAELAGRLSERDRQLVEAMRAWRLGDGERAEDLYRTVLGTWPDDVEAWLQLAEILNHFKPMRGGSVSESRVAFERVLRYEPDHLASLWHLARIEGVEGRLEAADSLVERIRSLAPEGDRTLELLAMRAARSRPEDWPWIVDSLMVAQDLTRHQAVWNVAVYAEDVDRARELAMALQEPTRSTEVRATGYLLDAFFALARGLPAESAAAMERVAGLDRSLALSHAAALALLPFADSPPQELNRHAARVEAWDAQPACRSNHSVRYYEPGTCIRPVVREYLSGLLEARLGRRDRARARAVALESWPEDESAGGHPLQYAAEIEAEIAIQSGDSVGALQALEAAPAHVWYVEALQSYFYSHSRARFRHAQLLEAAGRVEEALRWYESFDEMSEFDLVFQGPAQLRAGAILESLGRRTEASAHYRKALHMLEGGEGPWGIMARQAAEGIARTTT